MLKSRDPKINTEAILRQAHELLANPPVQKPRHDASVFQEQLPELNQLLKQSYGGQVAILQGLIDYVGELEGRVRALEAQPK